MDETKAISSRGNLQKLVLPFKRLKLIPLALIAVVVIIGMYERLREYEYKVSKLEKQVETYENYEYKYNEPVLAGWGNCLEQLNIKADAVLMGDSLTYRGDFALLFPDQKLVNLGIGSDTIIKMNNRVDMINAVDAPKLFLLSGINSLRSWRYKITDQEYLRIKENLKPEGIDISFDEYSAIKNNLMQINVVEAISDYKDLVANILEQTDIKVYLISVLPVSKTVENRETVCSNETIKYFNKHIEALCDGDRLVYIDLYSHFVSYDDEKGEELNSLYTTDGVHLTEEGYAVWAGIMSEYLREP